MAEETKNISTESTVTENQQTTSTTENTNTPTVEELMAQIAAERAEKEKNKTALDKALKEKGEITKALRAKQTAEEQEAEAQAEAQRLADEERESMRKELNHIKAVNAYKNIESEKTVESLIDAVSEADHNAIAQIIENEKKQAVKIAEAEWLKSRPQVGSNSYSSMTREQIMAMTDRDEKLKAIAMNPHLFK